MKKFTFLFLFIVTIVNINAGNIKGKITAANTETPLPGVNVFISGSTIGTATANNGTYEISTIPPGKYTVVVSMIGYERKTFDVLIKGDFTLELNAELEEKVYKTDNVEVTALSPEEWYKAFEIFKREFFGKNEFAWDCEIQNKEVINFFYEDGVLTATSDSVLKISNYALGYDIDIEIDKVVYNPIEQIIIIQVYPKFSEMELTSEDKEDVIKNRRQVYLGSFRHLLTEMAVNDTNRFSFNMYKTGFFNNYDFTDWIGKKLPDFDSQFYQDSTFFMIRSDSTFMAHFYREGIEKEGIIKCKAPYLVFDSFGNILNGSYFITFGDWKDQRFSMQLPRDFKIDLYKENKY